MRLTWIKSSALAVALVMLSPAALLAQKDEKEKVKKDVQQIIITRSGEKDEKVVVEINGDKVTVNGKSIDELKDKDVKVRVNKVRDMEAFAFPRSSQGGVWNFNDNDNARYFNMNMNRAMLGVSTEKDEKGAKVTDITKESAAEKIGLKEGDIIIKIDDKKIETPDNLSDAGAR